MKNLPSFKFYNSQIFPAANFMNTSQSRMTHCPKCSKPLFNGGRFSGFAEFCLRCPWCHTDVEVSIEPKITVSVKDNAVAMESLKTVLGHSPKQEYFEDLQSSRVESAAKHKAPKA